MGLRYSIRVGMITAALAATPPPMAEEVADWTDSVAAALVEHRYRAGAAADRIVAVRCSRNGASTAAAKACEILRLRVAEALARRHFEVVEPRADFEVVSSWDHLACGREGAGEYLGWSVIEIRVPDEPFLRRGGREEAVVSATETVREVSLHRAPLEVEVLGALSGLERERIEAPYTLSGRRPLDESVASHLADRLACDLKALPDKFVLDGVSIEGRVTSPAQWEWARRVGERVVVHLNRVLRSGYVRDGSSRLELDLRALDDGAFRVVPRVVRLDERGEVTETLVDGERACGGDDCTARIVGFLSSLLGDLRVFGDDETAWRDYLRRRGLRAEVRTTNDREPRGVVVGQIPDAGAVVARIPGGVVTVQVSAGDTVAPVAEGSEGVRRESPADVMRRRLETVAAELDVSSDAVRLSLAALRRGGDDADALERLLDLHDPLTADPDVLPTVWKAWYEFSEPRHAPNYPGSRVNGFVREVSEALFRRLEAEVFDASDPSRGETGRRQDP